MQDISYRLTKPLLLSLVLLSPLLVLPVFTNFMVTTKLLLLFVVAVLGLGLFIYHTFQTRKIEIPRSSIIPSLALFGLFSLLSSLLTTTYPVDNLLGLGGAYISFVIIVFVGSLFIRDREGGQFLQVLNVSLIILAALSLLQTIGFGPARLINTLIPGLGLPNTGVFNITGSPFIALQVFVLGLIANVVPLIRSRKASPLSFAAVAAAGLGLILSLLLVLPGRDGTPTLLPFGVSWTIAVDILKAPRSALIGVGPENYSAAYQLLRPTWVNGMAWWSTSFGQASNVPLTLLTTGGLLSLGAWFAIVVNVVRHARKQEVQDIGLVSFVVAGFALQLLLPVNVVTLSLLGVALAFLIGQRQGNRNLSIHLFKVEKRTDNYEHSNITNPTTSRSPALLPLVLAGLVVVASFYGIGRAYAASYSFFAASQAMQTNDAVRTYELQQQATVLNPYSAVYRSNYGLTNLAIATALANKADATEEEKTQVGQLIQQAIREARASTLLRPQDSQTWLILAQIYRSLLGSAEGADQWATSAYIQAITTNPNDPSVRVELGGLLYGQKQYVDAISLFQQAAELKPDYTNAYYNLANALRAAGQLDQAKLAYQQTLTLLPAGSEDYNQVNTELESLEAELQASQSAQVVPKSESLVPSLVGQNVSESDSSLVSQPSSALEELTLPANSPTPATEPTPTASPTLTP